jgi:hypothetical protein
MELSLEDLKTRFRRHSVVATMQCTGNRRNDFNETSRVVKGLEWDGGSISTASGLEGRGQHSLVEVGVPCIVKVVLTQCFCCLVLLVFVGGSRWLVVRRVGS